MSQRGSATFEFYFVASWSFVSVGLIYVLIQTVIELLRRMNDTEFSMRNFLAFLYGKTVFIVSLPSMERRKFELLRTRVIAAVILILIYLLWTAIILKNIGKIDRRFI